LGKAAFEYFFRLCAAYRGGCGSHLPSAMFADIQAMPLMAGELPADLFMGPADFV
jgi:hypothetical protein